MKHTMIGVRSYTFGMVDRAYGGPEEGGWWYDKFEPLRVFTLPERLAEKFERRLNRYVDRLNEGRPSIGSVLSEGQYTFEEGIVGHTPRPYYE